jgi:hypothetical protein
MAVTRTGNWRGVSRFLGTLPTTLEEARQLSLRRWSLKAEALAKGHMNAQDMGWTPLAAKTVAAKLRRGESELILIATSSYFQAITSWTVDGKALVGVRRGTVGRDGQLIDVVARTHEFGAKNIPARPLWKPVLDETMRWHNANNTPQYLFRLAARRTLNA